MHRTHLLQSPEILILRTDYSKSLEKALGRGQTVSLPPALCSPQEGDGMRQLVSSQAGFILEYARQTQGCHLVMGQCHSAEEGSGLLGK